MSLLGPELLKRFHYLALSARRLGGSPLLASPRTRIPGGGTEVTGYRDYAPGDNFQHVYWTWCARRDELLVKLFEGEADRHIHILLDCSPSMGLGHPPKFRLARQIAAALGYASLLNLDRLSVAAFADGLVAELPPLRHQSRVSRLLRFLDELSPGGTRTNLARTAETFVRRPQRPGPVIVISDLYDPDGFQHGLDRLRASGYEPRVVEIVDPHETDPTMLGDVEILDVETQTALQATVTERAVERYRALMTEFHESVRDYCRRRSIVFMQFACDLADEEVMLRVLGARRDNTAREPQTAMGNS
jgi:uncharacterized protein (DUF58 family)